MYWSDIVCQYTPYTIEIDNTDKRIKQIKVISKNAGESQS